MPIGQTNPHAGTLRQNATGAERLLWSHLRNRQIGDFKFRRQATIGPYIADFLCAELSLIVEADGGQHSENTDRARTAFLKARGYTVLRFWNDDILRNTNGVLTLILAEAQKLKPSPNPLPPAGEGESEEPSPACGRGQGEGPSFLSGPRAEERA